VAPGDICDFCRKLDLQKFFDMDPRELYDEENGFFLANAGKKYRGQGPYNCSLCRLFAASRLDLEWMIGSKYKDEIRVFSFLRAFHRFRNVRSVAEDELWKHPDLIVLSIMPPESIIRRNNYSPQDILGYWISTENQYIVCFDQSKKASSPFAAQILGPEPSLTTISE
jgi:hypothetical protein